MSEIETFESIKRWKESLRANSMRGRLPGKNWYSLMSQLGAYLEFIGSGPDAGMTPDDLLAEGLSNPDKAKSRLMEWYNWIQGGVVEGYSPWTRDGEPRKVSQGTAVTYVGRLRGFYTHNKVVFGKWKMPSRETGRTREADSQLDVFRFDEENGEIYVDNPLLQQFMAHLSFRDQTIALAVYSTSQDAVDLFKLTLGWLRRQDKESRLFWEGNRVKTGEQFKVFLSREATEFIRRYAAQERAGAGDDEPIWVKGREYDITLNGRTYGVGGPMEPSALNFNFRRAAEEMGLTVPEQPNPMRPKRFRHLFRTACTSAGLDPGVSQGFMGHATPVSARYLSQGKAFLLSQYVIIEPFLTVFKSRGEIDVQSIRADLNAVRKERDEIRSALNKFQSENSDLKDGLGELDRRVKVAEGDRARFEGEVANLREEAERSKARWENTVRNLETFENVINSYARKVNVLEKIIREHGNEELAKALKERGLDPETWIEVEDEEGSSEKT